MHSFLMVNQNFRNVITTSIAVYDSWGFSTLREFLGYLGIIIGKKEQVDIETILH